MLLLLQNDLKIGRRISGGLIGSRLFLPALLLATFSIMIRSLLLLSERRFAAFYFDFLSRMNGELTCAAIIPD